MRDSSETARPAPRICLVGHRTTGKTTLGAMLAGRLGEGWRFVDLDADIARVSGKTPDELLAHDPAHFRDLEAQRLQAWALPEPADAPAIIAVGAGCQALPAGPLYIWLWRDGWEESARQERARLRPDLDFDAEVRWMRETRESRWRGVAHLFFQIPRARAPQLVARMLADHIRWALDAPRSEPAARTWMVPTTADEVTRSARDTQIFGLAGIEVRSDFFDESALSSPTFLKLNAPRTPLLASLRHPSPSWLEHVCAQSAVASVDIDRAHLDACVQSGILERLTPRRLLISAHPDGVDEAAAADLLSAAQRTVTQYPAWWGHVGIKYAPVVQNFADLRRAFAHARRLGESRLPLIFLPQGERFAWTRPLLLGGLNPLGLANLHNYVPVGVRPARLVASWSGATAGRAQPTPMDLQDWLGYFAVFQHASRDEGAPIDLPIDGLIGLPVAHSMGDWWHISRAIQDVRPAVYVKIPLGEVDCDAEVNAALEIFEYLGLRGLSVTSPLKRRVVRCAASAVEVGDGAPMNTLKLTAGRWVGRDTDEIGMSAALAALALPAGEPRTAAIMGRGGVSPAVRRALIAAGWQIVLHASAREGWPETAPTQVTLVVNAAASDPQLSYGAPACRIWLDLHYHDVQPKPPQALRQENGDVFFEAQAQAQRDFWQSSIDGGGGEFDG